MTSYLLQTRHWVWIGVGFAVDQLTKLIASNTLSFFSPTWIFKPYLSFQLVHNTGAAYGIFNQYTGILIAVGITIITACIIWQKHIVTSSWTRFGYIFLMIGAFGNLIDRIRLGYVVDFIDIKVFPVFNIADVCIDIAIVLFLIDLISHGKTTST